ncbi:hypothetical protein LS72_004555 [Helicobacter apodemus]|uniref:Restriction endonuclease n=1 Tax=Helicobacter apodemus TaxID=135569 RepID=A0A4U8UGW3_9HELI|nr:hypothetical protein LS72_004555 [Helicobacter apodemus]
MNKLFESFVASEMKKWLYGNKISNESNEVFMEQICGNNIELGRNFDIKTQEKSKYLVTNEDNKNRFQLNPDIVGYKKQTKQTLFIADTKWKILNEEQQNYGISQSDMYQIFAYLTKYQCKRGFLIYPKVKDTLKNLELIFKPEILNKDNKEANKATLTLCFFNV